MSDICSTNEWAAVGAVVTGAMTLAAPVYLALVTWALRLSKSMWSAAIPPKPTGSLIDRIGGWLAYPFEFVDKSTWPALVTVPLLWVVLVVLPVMLVLGSFGLSANWICLG